MEKYLPIVNNRLDDLIKITIENRKEKHQGLGITFLDFSEPNKLDCRYVGLSDELFPDIVKQNYYDRMTSVPTSVIFFLIYDGIGELLYEVDLDKNSTFYDKKE
jgi:hypothetical protein